MVSFCAPRTIVTFARAFGRQVTPGVRTIVKWNPAAGLTLLAVAAWAAASDNVSAAAAPRMAVVRPARRSGSRRRPETFAIFIDFTLIPIAPIEEMTLEA